MKIEVGTEVYIGVRGRGGHGAYIEVTKINRKSIKGIERQGSYRPGTQWTISAPCEIAINTYDGSRVDTTKGLITGLRRQHWGVLGERGEVELRSIADHTGLKSVDGTVIIEFPKFN